MPLLEHLGVFRQPPDPRSRREIDDDIRAELEFHLDLRTEELRQTGLSEVAARRAALASFGDLDQITRECRSIRRGERVMLQRVNLILMVVVLCAVGYSGARFSNSQAESSEELRQLRGDIGTLAAALGTRAGEVQAAEPAPRSNAEWLALFGADMSWREALPIGRQIAALDRAAALNVMEAIYADIPSAEARKQILKAFQFGDPHPDILRILDLAARDPELEVQSSAFAYLVDYAFQDFSVDYDRYLAWSELYTARPLEEVIAENARELVARLGRLQGAELAVEVRSIRRLNLREKWVAGVDRARLLEEAGLLQTIEGWLERGAFEPDTARQGLEWVVELGATEEYLRRCVVPLLQDVGDTSGNLRASACRALGQPGNDWATQILIDEMLSSDSATPGSRWPPATALAEIGDARVIPIMIAALEADETGNAIYDIGYYGLRDLTGVRHDESHDGAWWRQWWLENRDRLPEEVRELEIPKMSLPR